MKRRIQEARRDIKNNFKSKLQNTRTKHEVNLKKV